MSKDITQLSAQVVLRSDSISEAEQVRNIFAAAGFQIGPLVANNFSITAPPNKFEKFFKIRVQPSKAGGVQFAKSKGKTHQELRGEDLPSDLGDKVETIVVSPPPDFGPFNP
jgi:hypothetical protein